MPSMLSKICKGSVGCTPNELCLHDIVSYVLVNYNNWQAWYTIICLLE